MTSLGFCLGAMKCIFVPNLKTRVLSMGEKQAILKLGKDGKLIRAIGQTLGITIITTIWDVLKRKKLLVC